jgi:TonB-linked SusC/RagA family outer membrane protein
MMVLNKLLMTKLSIMKKQLFTTFALILFLFGSVSAQQHTVTGTVISQVDGISLPGVTVMVQGAENLGTITDVDGKYSVNVPEGGSLIFSYVGFIREEVEVGNRSVIDLVMMPDITQLEEIVVTALGIERETKALGFSAQEIGEDNLSASREVSLTGFLAGKVAGVQVSKTASGAGGSSSVTIRGNSSLSGTNQPLYVVDGVPIINLPFSGSVASTNGGIDRGDGIGDINPEDVESMTVLKGPNASALYGSRGANGVIMITTKSGKKRKGIGVEINSNLSVDVLNLFPHFQNKYATGYEDLNLYGSLVEIDGQQYETINGMGGDVWGPPLAGGITVVDPYVYPEDKNTRTLTLLPTGLEQQVRDFYDVGITNTNTVAISGGNEKTTARLSLGNTSIKGIVPNHKVDRYNINLRATSKLSESLSFDGKMTYMHTEGNQRPALGATSENVSRNFAAAAPFINLSWWKEYYETTGDFGRFKGLGLNPYYIVNELKNKDYRDRFIGFASMNLKMTDWLSFTGRVGGDVYAENTERKWPVGSLGNANSKGRVFNSTRIVKEFNADALLTASKQVSDDFSLSATVGASILSQRRDYQAMDARNFKAVGVYHVSNAQDYYPSSSLWQKEMQSLYFMGQVAFRDYLFVDLTGRNDWSSALGRDNYSFFYPSVATSFVFTDALNMNSEVLSFGKIRASWAQVGNDSGPYLTKEGYSSSTIGYDGRSLTSKSGRIPPFDLKNELTESWEVGADVRFFQNRLSLDVTYYDGKTTNQILPTTISSASGYGSVTINAGEVRNKGIEAVLNATPVATGSFRWDVAFNYAKNNSEVVELAPGVETILLSDSYANDIEARPGERYGNIVGYATKKAPDGQLIVGSNGAYVKEAQKSILGNITPDWVGGLNNTLSYKGLSLNFLLDFVQGGEITSETKYRMMGSGTGKFTEVGREGSILPGVVEVEDGSGNITYEPNAKAVDGQTYWATRAWGGPTDWFVVDGSYIMLREVMLGYNFQPSLLAKTPFNSLAITLVGRNLWYIENHLDELGVSPESGASTDAGAAGTESFALPTTRTFGVNVKLTF